jgi:nitrite reductase (NADH) small subunit
VLRCPWHGWEFDPKTGRCLDDPAMRVAVYDAKVVDGRVLVQA